MNKSDLLSFVEKLKLDGIAEEHLRLIHEEIDFIDSYNLNHKLQDPIYEKNFPSFYDYNDAEHIAQLTSDFVHTTRLYALDKLLERDKLREKDGFPRKIKLGKLVKPAKEGNGKTIIIPTASEEKFYHHTQAPSEDGEPTTGGSGEGEEGDVVGEEPLREGDGQGAGQGKSGKHGMGAEAYEVGKILTEQFELPNIKEKGKKTSFTKYTYHLSDKNRGHGQLIDKKATLKQVVKTNLALGTLKPDESVDTSKMIITPGDRIYRILSKERDYESQAIVFFLRDYSGSMYGKPTEVVVTQHIYIHSWLVYQYKRLVKSRFFVHDTEAIEVPDFYTYYNKQVAGGTEVSAAYQLVNEIVEKNNLSKDYNIYIFHGTDGDDWDQNGERAIPELKKMIRYANRIGITIASNGYNQDKETVVEQYINKSKLLEDYPDILHLNILNSATVTEEQIINSIKELIA